MSVSQILSQCARKRMNAAARIFYCTFLGIENKNRKKCPIAFKLRYVAPTPFK